MQLNNMKNKSWFFVLLVLNSLICEALPAGYADHNEASVSFDVSMPIDSTGYRLYGANLKGGRIKFSDKGHYIMPLLASEVGQFETPRVTNLNNQVLINTKIKYHVIKLISPQGISNFFIKVGTAKRTQTVFDLDPSVLKNGTYAWSV